MLAGETPRRIVLFPENVDAAKRVHFLANRYIEEIYHKGNSIYSDNYNEEAYEQIMSGLKRDMILQGFIALVALIIGGILLFFML